MFVAPRTLVLATRNRDKVREMTDLLSDLPVRVVCAADLPGVPEVVEDGETLEANALKKAREVAAATGALCLADDTGLFVDALGGEPGVHAARYAGPKATYADNCRRLALELEGVAQADRTAHFACVMAFVDPTAPSGPVERSVEGRLEGRILTSSRGHDGFGYDPVFLVAGTQQTLAEMSLSEKNRISHRAQAARRMKKVLLEHLAGQEGRGTG
jgi:XTP/dITP diphosphohydrolase